MNQRALLIGNSDGIGLAITRLLLDRDWSVHGISRSASPVDRPRYSHRRLDVRAAVFSQVLQEATSSGPIALVIYCAGIGEQFDPQALNDDVATFETNLLGLVRTVEHTLPHLLTRGAGALVGLSSMADSLRSPAAPAYGASKAAMSHYLEALGAAVRGTGVSVVNVRLGFVDTKMAKSSFKPFLLQPEEAAERILRGALASAPPRRLDIPRRMAVLTTLARALSL